MTDERGRALVMALIVLGIGSLLIPPFLSYITTNVFACQATEEGIKEYYSADAAIEYTLRRLKCDPDFAEGLTFDQPISYTVAVGNVTVPITVTKCSELSERTRLDVVLVMDYSGSMNDDNGGQTDPWVGDYLPIGDAKFAARAFVGKLDPAYDQVGLVPYSTTVSLGYPLTEEFQAVKDKIDSIEIPVPGNNWRTNISDAIAIAAEELQDNGRPKAVKVIVLLSDGKANEPDPQYPDYLDPDEYAEKMADDGCEDTPGGINFFSLGLGTDVDADLMKYIARDQGCEPNKLEFYQETASSGDLQYKFESIAVGLTAQEYVIVATVGGTTIETRAQVCTEGSVGILTWLIR